MRRARLAMMACLALASGVGAARAQTTSPTARARVVGTVFDSVAMRPLAGAYVQLVAANDPARIRVTTSAPNGSFFFDSVSIGAWFLGFTHPSLEILNVEAPPLRVDVRTPGVIETTLVTESAQAMVKRICHTDVTRDSVGLFMGFVRHANGTTLADKGHLRVRWTQVTIDLGGIERHTPSLDAEAGATGGFAVCGVPLGWRATARAWSGSDSSGVVEVELPSTGLLLRNLLLSTREDRVDARSASAATDSTAARTTGERGRLRGMVRRSNGTPVAGARLLLWGSGVEAVSGADGSYAMRALPVGSTTLELRALGFFPARRPIDVFPDSEIVEEIEMQSLPTALDTVKVMTQQLMATNPLEEFEARRRTGFGYFMDAEAIRARQPLFVADLFRGIAGVVVLPDGSAGYVVQMRSSGTTLSAYCSPAVFIDGARVPIDAGNLDEFLTVPEIRAFEVYTRNTNAPAEFMSAWKDACGTILVHTGSARAPNGGKR